MNTTIGSSLPFVAEIANCSPDCRHYIYSLGDAAHATSPKKQAAARKACQVRSTQVRSLIAAAVENLRPQLVALNPHHRAAKVQAHLKNKQGLLYDFTTVPDLRTIRAVLVEMDI